MRSRLNLLSLAVTSMMAIAFLVPLIGLVSDISRDRALDAAEQDAQLISQLISATSDVRDPIESLNTLVPEGVLNGRSISLVTSDGRAAGSPVPSDEDLDEAFGGAASNSAIEGGRAILVPAFQPGGEISVVRIVVTDAELTSGVAQARIVLAALSVTLVGVALLITDRLARGIVAPVRDLSSASSRLASGELEARVTPAGPPEIQEVGQQFNRLATEIAALLQAERETAADLSHRLRTPLTAARLDAERIQDASMKEIMMADLDAVERSVDHAIELLRAPGRAVSSRTIVESVVEERAIFWEPLAAEQDRDSTVDVPSTRTEIGVAEDDLVASIDALIGNIFTHTPEGAAYRLSVKCSDDAAVVTIEDAGPGFDDAKLEERGASSAGSTGLGLDIARRTAELAGGTMRVAQSDLGGAAVHLSFARSVAAV